MRGSDQVALWLSTYAFWPPLEGVDTRKVPATELFQNYSQWAAQNGHLKVGSHKYQKRLIALGVERVETKIGYSFILQRRSPLAVMNGGLNACKEPTKG